MRTTSRWPEVFDPDALAWVGATSASVPPIETEQAWMGLGYPYNESRFDAELLQMFPWLYGAEEATDHRAAALFAKAEARRAKLRRVRPEAPAPPERSSLEPRKRVVRDARATHSTGASAERDGVPHAVPSLTALAGTSGASVTGLSRRLFGLSWVQLGMLGTYGSTCFGSDSSQLDDCARLGATLLHHTGTLDLTWSNLVPDPSDTSMKIGLPVPVGRLRVINLVNSPTNRIRLVASLRSLRERGLRVILTCFPWRGRDHDETRWESNGVAEALWLPWSSEHPREQLASGGQASDNPRTYDIFDNRSGYQIEYLSYIGEGIGALLIAVAEELASPSNLSSNATPFGIGEVVMGLQMFNRLGELNVVPLTSYEPSLGRSTTKWGQGDAWSSVWPWGEAWLQGVGPIKDALEAAGVTLPIFLPGMAGYYEDKTERGDQSRHSFSYAITFLRLFVWWIEVLLVTYEDMTLGDLVSGMNYEWDHRSVAKSTDEVDGGARLGPRHIGWLYSEIEDIKDALAFDVDLDIPVFVLDTGISVTDKDEFLPSWMPDYEEFQAYEVWRRLCGAVAGGARAAGWQAWMSSFNTNDGTRLKIEHYTMGLRNDDLDKSDFAALAEPRPSWVAYQRLCSLLGEVTSGKFVHPVGIADYGFHSDTGETRNPTADENLVIMHFRYRTEDGAAAHAWIIIVDSTASENDAWEVRGEWSSTPGSFERLSTFPRSISAATGGSETDLPIVSASFAVYAATTLPVTYSIRPGNAPIFVRATRQIEWTVTYVG